MSDDTVISKPAQLLLKIAPSIRWQKGQAMEEKAGFFYFNELGVTSAGRQTE